MATTEATTVRPTSAEEALEALRAAGAEGRPVRPRGGGTKLSWGTPIDFRVDLDLGGIDSPFEHNEGDLTAVLGAGVPLARAQEAFASADQMLAVDPPLGRNDGATMGGVFATADSGPLRHRYGGPRDLIIGISIAMSDGARARAGGHVIKNVAGYDLAKLFTGSFGTLGLILEVVVRLHPLDPETATVRAAVDDPDALAAAVSALAHARMETVSLDVAWAGGEGAVLGRFGGRSAADQAGAAVELLSGRDGVEADVIEDDPPVWEAQRAGQRGVEGGAVVKVSSVQAELPRVLRTAERLGGSVVGRAGLGVSWIGLEGSEDDLAAGIEELRRELAPAPCAVQAAPAEVRRRIDPWQTEHGPGLELMRRTKARFDPPGVCNVGLFAGGI